MKIGPMDFNQPSTWRGLIGLAAIGGISFSPALAEQMALLAATAIALIEMFRDEYRTKKPTAQSAVVTQVNPATPPAAETGAAVPAGFNPDAYGERAPDGLRNVPPEPETPRNPESFGFGDR